MHSPVISYICIAGAVLMVLAPLIVPLVWLKLVRGDATYKPTAKTATPEEWAGVHLKQQEEDDDESEPNENLRKLMRGERIPGWEDYDPVAYTPDEAFDPYPMYQAHTDTLKLQIGVLRSALQLAMERPLPHGGFWHPQADAHGRDGCVGCMLEEALAKTNV